MPILGGSLPHTHARQTEIVNAEIAAAAAIAESKLAFSDWINNATFTVAGLSGAYERTCRYKKQGKSAQVTGFIRALGLSNGRINANLFPWVVTGGSFETHTGGGVSISPKIGHFLYGNGAGWYEHGACLVNGQSGGIDFFLAQGSSSVYLGDTGGALNNGHHIWFDVEGPTPT